MLRLFPFIKRYFWMIAGAVVLLFLQANIDLTLPDYLSRIVNIGIQQGGVQSSLPQAMRVETFDNLKLFLPEAEQARLSAAYDLLKPGDLAYPQTITKYPAVEGQAFMVLKELSPAEAHPLSAAVQPALVATSSIQAAANDPQKLAEFAGMMGFDPARIPVGSDLFQLISMLTSDQRQQMITKLEEQTAALEPNLRRQMGIAAVKAEYNALGMNTSSLQNNYILTTGGWMLLLSLFSVAAAILVGLLSSRVAAGIARDLREAVFTRVTRFSLGDIENFSTASLITRSTNDINQLQMVTMMIIRMVFFAPIIGIGGIIRALDKAPGMWWIIALMVTLLLVLVGIAFAVSLPKFKIIQKLIDALNRVAREALSGMMVIRAFNRQKYEENRFDIANRDLTENMLFVSRVMVVMMPMMMLLTSSVSVLVVWVGAHEVVQSQIQVGDMMAFIQYTMQIFFAFMMMSFMFIMLPRASASAERIAEILETQPSINDPQDPVHFPADFKGEVEFRNVSFRYPDAEEDVLHDVSFTAKPGETTAIIGTTGSGKSTIINLIPRFFDVTEGAVLIDGVDVRSVSQHELRSKIGFVPQKSNLFSGTIASNLRLGNEDASDSLLEKALMIAQAKGFVDSREGGMGAEISQGGGNVSGGQRQRLAIARGLSKNAAINIFDDSFSALDYKTDAALRKSLQENRTGQVFFIVSQRVATIKNAEQIIVLDEGKVVGKGSHKELMQTSPIYRDIALSQLSEEELS